MTFPPAAAPILTVRGVSKTFPGVKALDNIDFDVRPGEVHALLGENGAGKSTLIKLLAGYYEQDKGEILIGGKALPAMPSAAHKAGIATIHQEHHLVPNMTVAENIMLGQWPTRFGLISAQQQNDMALAALALVAPNLSPGKGVFSHNDEMVRGIVSALRQIGKLVPPGEPGHVVVIGLDGTPLALDRIREGTQDATVAQDPYAMGGGGILEQMISYFEGKEYNKSAQTKPYVITKANVDDKRNWRNFGK